MNKHFMVSLFFCALTSAGLPALADDHLPCFKCHEPADDWEGMSTKEIIAETRNPKNKLHKDVRDLTDEQLRKMIKEVLSQ